MALPPFCAGLCCHRPRLLTARANHCLLPATTFGLLHHQPVQPSRHPVHPPDRTAPRLYRVAQPWAPPLVGVTYSRYGRVGRGVRGSAFGVTGSVPPNTLAARAVSSDGEAVRWGEEVVAWAAKGCPRATLMRTTREPRTLLFFSYSQVFRP